MPATKRKRDAGVPRAAEPGALPVMPGSLLRLGQYLVIALLILVPLAVARPGSLFYNALDTPRRLLLYLGAGLLAALIVRAWSLRRRIVLRWHLLDVAVLLYLVGAVVSSLGGSYPRISFFGPLWTQDGLLLLWCAVCLYFGVKEFLRTPESLARAAVTMGLVGGVVAVVGLFDRFVIPQIGKEYALNPHFFNWRLVGTMGNSMFTGTYFAVTIPLAFGAALATASPLRRWLLWGSIALMVPSLLFTMARAAWIGFALCLPLLLILAVLQWRKTHAALSAIVLAVGLLLLGGTVAVGLATPQIRDRMRSVVNMEDATVKTRMVYMTTSYNLFRRFPIQGTGYGNIKTVFPQYRPSSDVIESGIPLNRGYSTAQPHNILLQVAAESGLLGLVPFLFLVVLVFVTGFRLLRGSPPQAWLAVGMLGSLAAYFVTNLFTFDNAATMAHFWAVTGLLAGMGAVDRALPVRYGSLARPLSPALVSLFNVASLVLALGAGLGFLAQTVGAHQFQSAIGMTTTAEEILRRHATRETYDAVRVKQALQLYQAGVSRVQSAIKLSPLPDHVQYQVLFVMLRGLHKYIGEPGYEARLRREMTAAAEAALALCDRDSIVNRFYILECLDSNDLQKAYALAERLVRFEPRSAEVRLLFAQTLQRLDELDRALREVEVARELDPTLSDTWGLRGKVLFLQAARETARTAELMPEVAYSYGRVMELGADLFPPDRLGYAIALVYSGAYDRAVEEAHIIRGTGEFEVLCSETEKIFNSRGRPAFGRALVARMRGDGAAP